MGNGMEKSESGLMVPRDRPDRAQLPAQQQATDLLSAVAHAATDPRVDVEKMQALFAMRNEEIARVARLEFSEAMAAAQGEIEPVRKGAYNAQTRSTYAKLDRIVQMIVPVYSRHGFGMSFGTAPGAPEGCVRVTCDLRHRGGHSEHYELDMPLDATGIQGSVNKTGPHARGSSLSYARRYLTCMVWNIPTTDDDDGVAGGGSAPAEEEDPRISSEERDDLQERLEAAGVDVAKFCRLRKVDSLADLRRSQLAKAFELLKQREGGGEA